MKPALNVLREFKEIYLRNSRFSSKHNAIRFYAGDRGVFVFLAINGPEVLGEY
jgi:hypothetical protein